MGLHELTKPGLLLVLNNEPYRVVFSQHARTAQRRAFVRTKLKNLITGQTVEKTFNASDKVEEANVDKVRANFLYAEKDQVLFMNNKTYEQISFRKDSLFGQDKFLKEGGEVNVLIFKNNPISIELPNKVDLLVVEAPPSVKGNSATSPTKTAILETGGSITVPIFIKEGDVIRINTETGEYVERA